MIQFLVVRVDKGVLIYEVMIPLLLEVSGLGPSFFIEDRYRSGEL